MNRKDEQITYMYDPKECFSNQNKENELASKLKNWRKEDDYSAFRLTKLDKNAMSPTKDNPSSKNSQTIQCRSIC